jgi:orotate phosphoribosyltransferase
MQPNISKLLLEIGAVFLSPEKPFTWVSGIKSPVYCDNRLLLTAPEARTIVETELAGLVKTHFPQAEILMGTATAGIAHAAITAEILNLPMGYVRSSSKQHGRGNQIEGRIEKGQKAVVVEDLISTASSCIDVVEVLRNAEVDVLGIVSIFTYGMKKGLDNLQRAKITNYSLSNFDVLIQTAVNERFIKQSDIEKLLKFRNNPSDESWLDKK